MSKMYHSDTIIKYFKHLLYNPNMPKESMREQFKKILYETNIRNYDSDVINNEKINNLSKTLTDIKPQKLYRYRTYNKNSLDALKNNLITFSNTSSFNDPFDSLVYINPNNIFQNIMNPSTRQDLAKWLNINPHIKNLIPAEMYKNLITLIEEPIENYQLTIKLAQSQFKKLIMLIINSALIFLKNYPHIACFSETQYSPTMWAHYADSHQGYVLEYDQSIECHSCSQCKNKCRNAHYDLLLPVIYSNERYDANNFVIEYISQNLFANNSNVFVPNNDRLSMHKILIHKSKDWEYEREWRMILLCNTIPKVIQKPTGIYLGINMPEENKRILYDFAKVNGIKVYQMYIEPNTLEYKINSYEIL